MQQTRSFFHDEEAEPFTLLPGVGDVETLAVIGNRQRPLAGSVGQHHLRAAGPGMFRHVTQRFLRSPKQTQRHVGRDWHEVFRGAERHLDAVCAETRHNGS